jgi:uncharacterized protein (TIRG00374 family)
VSASSQLVYFQGDRFIDATQYFFGSFGRNFGITITGHDLTMKNKLMKVIAFLCLGLFFYIFFRVGPKVIWRLLTDIAWYNWLILFSLRIAYLNLRTLNWGLIAKKYDMHIPYWQLFKARLAGQAVGFLSPQPKIAAEAVRALVLEDVGKAKVFASVVVDKTTDLMATIGLVVIGVITAVIILDMPPGMKWTFILLTLFLALIIGYFYRKQRKGLFIWLLDLMQKFKIRSRRLESHRDKIQGTDAYISEFYRLHKKTFALVFLLYIMQFLLWAFEFHITLLAVGAEGISYLDSFLVLALGNLAYTLPAVPASLGIYEITFMSIFRILGIPIRMGITFILVRRFIGLSISGIGIIPILKRKSFRELRKKTDPTL